MRWICVRAREVFIAPVRPMQTRTLEGAQCVPTGSGLFFLLCILGRGEPRSEMRYIRVGLLLKLYSLAVLRYGRALWPLKKG